jgi:uncharacterized iron-regulated membrane protein
MYKLFFKIHLYAAIIVCPFLLIFAITGSLMAFEPEIDHLLHSKLSYVEPGPKPLSLAVISDKIHNAYPKDTINGYELSTSPDISYQVYTNSQAIYVNPYTGKILGTMTAPDFWQNAQNSIHQLHLRLAFRDNHDIGGSIMSWSGVILLIILPSGLILWWRQKRIAVRWNGQPRLVWFDIHSLTGVVSFTFLIIAAFTGVMIGFESKTVPLFYKLTGSKPTESTPGRPTQMSDVKILAPPNSKQILPDSAIQIARKALPGTAPFNINIPAPTEPYMVRSRYPEDRTPGGRSRVMIDPYSGKVLFAEGSRTAPAGERMVIANRAIHTGDIFGIPSKIIMSLASLALGFQVISGLRMWWLRKWGKKKVVRK